MARGLNLRSLVRKTRIFYCREDMESLFIDCFVAKSAPPRPANLACRGGRNDAKPQFPLKIPI